MATMLPLTFSESVALLRRELALEGLETASEWDSALDLRDTMGPKIPDLRCIFVFDPVSLLLHAETGRPASALASVTLQSLGNHTAVSVSGRGPSYRKACDALLRCTRQLPPLRHAA